MLMLYDVLSLLTTHYTIQLWIAEDKIVIYSRRCDDGDVVLILYAVQLNAIDSTPQNATP